MARGLRIMIDIPTALILGAGASMDFAYPSARGLKDDVLDITRETNSDAYRCLLDLGFENTVISAFSHELRFSGRPSVDAFLEHRHEFIPVGKAAMTLALIGLENINTLFKTGENWYEYLFNRMEAPFDEFASNQVRFITFNYDRSLESFLFRVLQSAYGKSPDEVADVLPSIPIIHVHGKLGDLPWESRNGRNYESTMDPHEVLKAAQGIRIISEASPVDEAFARAISCIAISQRIVFLGFGYHAANLKRLRLDNSLDQRLWGSCFGMTDRERAEVEHHFRPRPITLGAPHAKALQFLREELPL